MEWAEWVEWTFNSPFLIEIHEKAGIAGFFFANSFRYFFENISMNDYDFGKYYRSKNKTNERVKPSEQGFSRIYKKISIGLAFTLVVFFTGLMTGINFQEKRSFKQENTATLTNNQADVIESADISSNPHNQAKPETERRQSSEETSGHQIKSTLIDPDNAYIILAKRYHEDSKDRALYYAGVLKKIVKDYDYDVIPSVRGKAIKIYVGPMKGKKNAEKMLARVKSIPEFTNSAILYKK